MSRRFAIAAVLVLVLLGLGYALSGLFAGDPPAPASAPAAAPIGPAPSQRSGAAPVAPDGGQVAAPEWHARLTGASGVVERRAPGGDWAPLAEGDELSLSDALRTGVDSSAVLELGAGTRVDITQETQFTVSQLSATVSGLRLAEGRIAARVEPRAESGLRVEVAEGDAVAETDEGEFTALTSGQGDLSVAATGGRVRLSARGRTVEVGAGQQSVAAAEAPPSEPRAIPASLFLKVGRPGKLRGREVRLAGATAPGAVVTVNGVPVRVDPDGRFEAEVALREGKNRVLFRAVDPVGRQQQRRVPLNVDSRGPAVKSEVRWR